MSTSNADQIADDLAIWGHQHRQLIKRVWLGAWVSGEWPDCDRLTRELYRGARPLDVFAVASQMPPALGHLEDGRILLTVRGSTFYPGAKRLLIRYVRGVTLAVRRYASGRRRIAPEVTANDFWEIGVKGHDARMLWRVIDAEPWALRRVDDRQDESGRRYALNSHAALALRGVKTLPAYLRAQAQAWWSEESLQQARRVAFGPSGALVVDVSPESRAEREHPTALAAVRDAFALLNAAGHHREAVERAVVAFLTQLRAMADLRLDGDRLVNEALAPERPRVRVADLGTDTGLNLQRGIHLLARGVIAAIRNPTAHELVELTEEEALEQHAILCFLARALDEAQTLRADESHATPR